MGASLGEVGRWERALRLCTCSYFLSTFCFLRMGAVLQSHAYSTCYHVFCHRKDSIPLETINQIKPFLKDTRLAFISFLPGCCGKIPREKLTVRGGEGVAHGSRHLKSQHIFDQGTESCMLVLSHILLFLQSDIRVGLPLR